MIPLYDWKHNKRTILSIFDLNTYIYDHIVGLKTEKQTKFQPKCRILKAKNKSLIRGSGSDSGYISDLKQKKSFDKARDHLLRTT